MLCDLQTKFKNYKKDRYDVLSIPDYVIKKAHLTEHDTETQRQRIYHSPRLTQKAKKNVYISILERFLKSPRYRESQISIGWNEEHCARDDAIAAEDHSYITTASERLRRVNTWVLVLNCSGPNGPMNQRADYAEAKIIKERVYEESGKGNTRLHPCEQDRQRPGQPFTWHDE